jgi:ATP-binding cassette subfamily C protein
MTLYEYVRSSEKIGLPRRSLYGLLILSVATTLAESIGLAMVVPIYDYVSVNGELTRLPKTLYWDYLFFASRTLNQEPGLAILLLLAFVAVLFRQIASYSRQMVVAKSREQVTKSLRDGIFERFINASLVEQESLKSGELVNILTNELTRFNASLAGFVALSNATVMVTVYGLLLAWTSWQMTLMSILVVVISFLPLRAVHKKTINAGKSATKANISATEFFVERLAPARLTRLSQSEATEIKRMRGFTSNQFNTIFHQERLMAFTAVLVEPIILGLVFSLLYVAVVFLMVPMGSLAVFLMVVLRLMPVAKDVMKGRQLILACAGSTLALLEMLKRLERAAEGTGGSAVFSGLHRSLQFKATSFRYFNSQRCAIENIELTLPAGSFVAIVGPSGAGKSTLIDLLPALRLPVSGKIEIDGQPLESFSLATLRSGIAYVPQQAQIYDITIAEHIRLGREDATEAEIEEAISLAGAAAFVAQLPNGMHSRLGQAGASLSGGQRQRIDLARAIVGRGSLLILDEPTSALDAESEKAFIATLKLLGTKRRLTILVVTHRLALVNYADQIVVMRDGHIEAVGGAVEVTQKSVWFADAISNYLENGSEPNGQMCS